MKKLLNLCSLFMAVIGLNAAIWVVYILAYPQLVGEFPKTDGTESFENITVLSENSADAPSLIAANTCSDNEILFDNTEKTQSNDAIPVNINTAYDPAKQQRFEELQNQKEQISQTQQQYSAPESNVQNNFASDTNTYNTNIPVQDSHKTYATAENTQEVPVTESDISNEAAGLNNVLEDDSQNSNTASPNHTGNSNNFNAHYNPHLQQTTDKFVLNTDSLIFHIPACNDVAKMAEKNYATSNSSYNEIKSLGYKPCGHCLKDYSASYSNFSTANDNTSNMNETNLNAGNETPDLQVTEVTYIINTKEEYFHKPNSDCKYLAMTTEQDSIATSCSYDELRAQGYHPCKHCGL